MASVAPMNVGQQRGLLGAMQPDSARQEPAPQTSMDGLAVKCRFSAVITTARSWPGLLSRTARNSSSHVVR